MLRITPTRELMRSCQSRSTAPSRSRLRIDSSKSDGALTGMGSLRLREANGAPRLPQNCMPLGCESHQLDRQYTAEERRLSYAGEAFHHLETKIVCRQPSPEYKIFAASAIVAPAAIEPS